MSNSCDICKWGPLKNCKIPNCGEGVDSKWTPETNLQMLRRMGISEWSRFSDYMWKHWLLKPVDEEILDYVFKQDTF